MCTGRSPKSHGDDGGKGNGTYGNVVAQSHPSATVSDHQPYPSPARQLSQHGQGRSGEVPASPWHCCAITQAQTKGDGLRGTPLLCQGTDSPKVPQGSVSHHSQTPSWPYPAAGFCPTGSTRKCSCCSTLISRGHSPPPRSQAPSEVMLTSLPSSSRARRKRSVRGGRVLPEGPCPRTRWVSKAGHCNHTSWAGLARCVL